MHSNVGDETTNNVYSTELRKSYTQFCMVLCPFDHIYNLTMDFNVSVFFSYRSVHGT